MRIVDIFKHRLPRLADAVGARLLRPDGSALAVSYRLYFTGWSPSILASFVAGATASQSGTTVTVTATGHSIVGNSSKDGYRIYYPGSASIPAGWYAGFAWVNANTITFQRAAATVASEPINGGAEFVSAQDICELSIPGGSLRPGTCVSVVTTRRSDTTSSNKTLRVHYGGTQLAASVTAVNSVFQSQRIGFVCLSSSAQVGLPNAENTPAGQSQHAGNVDTTVAQPLIVSGQLAGAGTYIAFDAVCVEIA